jgi:tetratricopeptide (TPR) repeat protein
MDPDFPVAHWFLGKVYYQKGDFALALSHLDKALSLGTAVQADIAFVHARSGNRTEALRILESLKAQSKRKERYVSQFDYAVIYTGLDDRDKAFAALHQAFEERPWDLASAKVDPLLDQLRSDRRFPEILRQLGLTA